MANPVGSKPLDLAELEKEYSKLEKKMALITDPPLVAALTPLIQKAFEQINAAKKAPSDPKKQFCAQIVSNCLSDFDAVLRGVKPQYLQKPEIALELQQSPRLILPDIFECNP